MPSPPDDEVALLQRYADAFAARDLDAAVGVYTFPAVLTSNQGTRVVPDADTARALISRAWASYEQLEIASAEFETGQTFAYSDALHQVELRWHIRRRDGSTLWRYPSWYLLRRTAAGWRIEAVITPELR